MKNPQSTIHFMSFWQKRRFGLYICLFIPCLFMAIMVVYPIIYNIGLSVQEVNVYTLARERPFIGLENYRHLWQHHDFGNVIRNTLVFTLGSIAIQLPFGLLFAIMLQRPDGLHRGLRALVAAGWMIPALIVGTVWRWLLNSDYGIINQVLLQFGILSQNIPWLVSTSYAMWGVILANVWFGIPFNMLLLSAGLAGIPGQIYQAAQVDGANRYHIFRFITLPLLLPTLLAVLVLGLLFTMKLFDLIWVLTGGGPVMATTVLSVWSYQLSFSFFNFGLGAALANMLSIVLLLVAIIYVWKLVGRESEGYGSAA